MSGLLTSEDIIQAKGKIYELSQKDSFPEVFAALGKGISLPRNHALSKFKLTLAKQGHILINSRVRDKDNPTNPKQLIPLHIKPTVTKLLVKTLHYVYSHAGISALASILATTFHIPNLRNLLKLVSRTCPACQRAYAKPLSQSMGMLPACRTTPAPPFDRTGVDFAGPFLVHQGYTRKPSYVKTYAAIFVCMATKAVHFELVSSLSAEDFLATFRRFIARRGCPSHVFSDNGTNFVGAREEIRELQQLHESKRTREAITNLATSQGICWHHTPPRAPHFGGLWEAAVTYITI